MVALRRDTEYGQIGLPEVDNLLKINYAERYRRRRLNNGNIPLPPPPTNEDCFSKLPDDILKFILSHIPMRERAATCILSRRWINVWSKSDSHINLYDCSVLGYQLTPDLITEKEKEVLTNELHRRRLNMKKSLQLRHFKRNKGFLDNQRAKFIKRVNHILELRRHSPIIDSMFVRFALVQESASHVDRWMKFAAARRVKNIHLDFCWGQIDPGDSNVLQYLFPFHQFASSSLSRLSLKRCIIQFPPNFQGLHFLVSLILGSSILTSERVQAILSNCPSLEFWSLRDCYSHDFITLSFVGSSIKLKHLDFGECTGISGIELRDLNLLSFELQMPNIYESSKGKPIPEFKLLVTNCPLLTRLALHVRPFEASIQTLTNVPRLETLSLRIQVSQMPELSALCNLKQLVFSVVYTKSNLFEVLCFLEACPLLQQLHVDMGIYGWTNEISEESFQVITRPECPHNNLKEVEIYGFDAHSEQIELANYLLKNAMVLEVMKLYTFCKIYCLQGAWRLSGKSMKPLRRPIDEVWKLLQKEKRVNTDVIVF